MYSISGCQLSSLTSYDQQYPNDFCQGADHLSKHSLLCFADFIQYSDYFIKISNHSIVANIDNSVADSLNPFTEDIINSVDVNTILPSLMSHQLLSRSQIDYFNNPYVSQIDKQRKLAFNLATLNENCVEMILKCLESTSDYGPHESLLKMIRAGK